MMTSATACMTELPTSAVEIEFTHAHQLVAESLVLFSHDHVRNTNATGRSQHFQDALDGGVTAMTLELTIDNSRFFYGPVEVFGPVATGAGLVDIAPYPHESTYSASQRFNNAHNDLVDIISHSGGQVRRIDKVKDIDDAKAQHQLGIIIGTEGALMLSDNISPIEGDAEVLANVESRYEQGWRKVQLARMFTTPFVRFNSGDNHITPLGQRLVRMLNKRGVVVDVMHLFPEQIDEIFSVTNAPIHASHDWAVCGTNSIPQSQLDKIVASGGGHGVISINALAAYYSMPGCIAKDGNMHGFVDTLLDEIGKVGYDHIAIGPDYMPQGIVSENPYSIPSIEGTPIPIESLVTELLSRGISDANIKKILGGNLRDLYQRIWDPTHGNDGGPAHFRLCSNTDTNAVCLAARSNGGQGDLRHRAINCGHPSSLTPVGLQLAYQNGAWVFKNLNGVWVPCSSDPRALALVVSWGDGELQNGRIALHGTPECDTHCQQATHWNGAGTWGVRALNCQSTTSFGIVGLQLFHTSGAWNFYNIAGQLAPCVDNSTLVVNWAATGIPNPNANVRLCDDYNVNSACANAAANIGSGTAQAKVLNCLSSTPRWNAQLGEWEHGTNSLQVFYSDKDFDNPDPAHWNDVLPEGGHWRYWDIDGRSHRCVHGSVLIATTTP